MENENPYTHIRDFEEVCTTFKEGAIDMELKAKISTLAGRVDELEGKRLHDVQAVTEIPAQAKPCINCQSTGYLEEHCLIAPSVRDLMKEQANIVGQSKPPTNAPYGNTYNPN